MCANCIACDEKPMPPRVVIVGLASCFGCQLQITNVESHLLEVLGQIEPMPDDFDVAIIEGAVTTEESEALVRELRSKAKAVVAIGACANTAGIPGMAAADYRSRPTEVYASVPEACGSMIAPRSVPSVIDVEYRVPCCPIDPFEFIETLHAVDAHDVRRLQAQRDGLLLRRRHDVPRPRDARRMRRALREPRSPVQRLPRHIARCQPGIGARIGRALRRIGRGVRQGP